MRYTQVVTKAGTPVPKSAAVRINAEDPKYVCRAGFKLEKALDHFNVDVTGVTALDSGLSTGGFTHCLLQRGARHVGAQDCDDPWFGRLQLQECCADAQLQFTCVDKVNANQGYAEGCQLQAGTAGSWVQSGVSPQTLS
jgi:predicted rRNA methylase YqxC with S4 and FtsJ domains